MHYFAGIDIGTSAVKVILVDSQESLIAKAEYPVATSWPQPLYAEQDQQEWLTAIDMAMAAIKQVAAKELQQTVAIGLSGQMHGLVGLDKTHKPLLPVMLWNDGRAEKQARELCRKYPELADRNGVLPMAGLTGPKILWLKQNRSEVFSQLHMVLSPKDYVRLEMTGELASDFSDAAGTWLLDQAERKWSVKAVEAVGLRPEQLPRLLESNQQAGFLRRKISLRWGMAEKIMVATGGGDCPVGAVGVGIVDGHRCLLSLGTSGQLFVPTKSYQSNTSELIHSFCHALPGRWFQMAAMLNGASPLSWLCGVLQENPQPLLEKLTTRYSDPADILFLPYLAGERTPHNDPHAKGVFFGMTAKTDRLDLTQAVLEGIGFTFADAKACLEREGEPLPEIVMIGGGSRSRLWAKILANILDLPLSLVNSGDKGPALGAARLARMAFTGEPEEAVCKVPEVSFTVVPDKTKVAAYQDKYQEFRRLYHVLRPEFLPGKKDV